MRKIDLENSPWALVLLVALACLVLMTFALFILPDQTGTIVAGMGVWSGLVVTSLSIGMARSKRPEGDTSGDRSG